VDLVTVGHQRAARSRDDLRLAPGEVFLAGGSWLFSEPQPAVEGLVDLTTMGWQPCTVDSSGLSIAATCTVAELLDVAARHDWASQPLFRQCAEAFLMSFKIWATATVGGNLCLALPAGAMITLAVALDAEVVVWTPDGGERREPVAAFVTGVGSTTLAHGEVLRGVEVPAEALASRTAFRKMALTPLGRSSAVVTGRVDPAGRSTVTVTAATTRPVVVRLDAGPDADVVAAALAAADAWYDDPHGPADWREHVTGLLVREVCAELGS